MTVSLSFTIVNTYAPQGAKPATPVERKTPPVQDDDASREHKRPPSRQNRLADAMMSALRELGFGAAATAATPAASPPAGTTASTAAPAQTEVASAAAPASVESAVQQFAHALFQALRQGDSDKKDSDGDAGRVAGHGHHRHHHHHHRHHRHGEGQGYGNLSQRLEALSQTVGTPAAAATPASATAAAAPVETATTSTTPPPPATTVVVVAPVATPAKTPLLDAFTKLFNALKPASTETAVTTPATDMAEKLRLFLHTLAQALAPDTMGSVQGAQVGGLVNVTA
jgi:hypothetical protein